MENEQKPNSKIALNYGILLGAASILVSVTLYALGMQYDQDWKQGTFGILVMIIVIFLGIKKYKELNGGFLTVGEAIKTGVGIALIGSIISLLYSFIFMNYIEPDFITNISAKAEQNMLENYPELTDEQIEQALSMTKKMTSPAIMTSIGLITSLIFGLIISSITGFILKKNKEQY